MDALLTAPCPIATRRARQRARIELRRASRRLTPDDLPYSPFERNAVGTLLVLAYEWFLGFFSARRWIERGRADVYVAWEEGDRRSPPDLVPDAAWRAAEKLVLRALSAKDASATGRGMQWKVRSAEGYLALVGRSAGTDMFRGWGRARRAERVIIARGDSFAAPVTDPQDIDERRLAARCFREVLDRTSSARDRQAVWCWFVVTLNPPVDLAARAVAGRMRCSVRTVYRRLARGEVLVRRWAMTNPMWHETAQAALGLVDSGADFRSLVGPMDRWETARSPEAGTTDGSAER